MDLILLVLQGKPQGKELPIHNSPFLIGRGPECHLRPNSDMVSRRHCALIVHGEEACIRDLGSTNGTIVDGERLTEEFTLTDGDIFQVGPLVFQVVIRRAAATKVPSVAPVATAAAQRDALANQTTKADENGQIVQWLVSDSKNEIPTSGLDVYGGETVFTTGAPEKNSASDAVTAATPHDDVQPVAKAAGRHDHTRRKGVEKTHKPAEATGAASHAAEDMLRQFMQRRPHK
jgi:pSer/pThr/pTyr-binding forkhead associated (FHA) protein